MKFKFSLLVILLTVIIGIGCEKNDKDQEEPKHCWQIVHLSGALMYRLCERTQTQMKDSFPNPCNYYKLGEEEFCWLIDNRNYLANVPESYLKNYMECFSGSSYTKVFCGYCQNWYTRTKSIYKPDNTATYSTVRVERICGDTVKTLYPGRKITLRETADSLIIVEFSNSTVF